jgi:hypothetical protein
MRHWLVPALFLSLLAIGGCAESSTRTSKLPAAEGHLHEATRSYSAPQDKQAEPAEEEEIQSAEPSASPGQSNALSGAEDYLSYESFSKKGLIEQLEYEGYKGRDAEWAANHVEVDWNEQAIKSAKNYLSYESFSLSGLVEQLEYEGFTPSQAHYGAETAYR